MFLVGFGMVFNFPDILERKYITPRVLLLHHCHAYPSVEKLPGTHPKTLINELLGISQSVIMVPLQFILNLGTIYVVVVKVVLYL